MPWSHPRDPGSVRTRREGLIRGRERVPRVLHGLGRASRAAVRDPPGALPEETARGDAGDRARVRTPRARGAGVVRGGLLPRPHRALWGRVSVARGARGPPREPGRRAIPRRPVLLPRAEEPGLRSVRRVLPEGRGGPLRDAPSPGGLAGGDPLGPHELPEVPPSAGTGHEVPA